MAGQRTIQTRPGDLARARQERDRFVAFAFTGSDLLIECTASGKVSFVSGAISVVGINNPSEFIGGDVRSLIADIDHIFIETLVSFTSKNPPTQLQTAAKSCRQRAKQISS